MKSKISIFLDSVVEAVWSPSVCEEHDGNGLAKIIQLQTTRTNSVHNRSIVNDLDRNVKFSGTNYQISMSRGTTYVSITFGMSSLLYFFCQPAFDILPIWITDNQESNIDILSVGQNSIALRLDHFAVSHNNLLSIVF